MRVLSRQANVTKRIEGQLSDGSDHREVEYTEHVVRAQDHLGRVETLTFDHDPTDDELIAAMAHVGEVSTFEGCFAEWWRYDVCHREAIRRGNGAMATALKLKSEVAWAKLVETMNG